MRRWLIIPAAVLVAAAASMVTQWRVQPGSSAIGFVATGGGQSTQGKFGRYLARIRFDPANLKASSAIVAIDLASATTGQKSIDDMLRDEDWFDVFKTPQALFTTTRFESRGGDRYVAQGQLRMRNVTAPVTLPFTLVISNGQASVSGKLTIDRTVWGIGVKDKMANNQVDKAVTVTVDLKANPLDAGKKPS